jgi:hypothetical protein
MEDLINENLEYLDAGNTSFVDLINELSEIRGYKAAGIMACDGELLYSYAPNLAGNYNLSDFMKVLNNLFAHTCTLTEDSSFGSCTEMSLKTGDEIVIIRCSCKDSLLGVRIFVLIEEQGNIAILHRQLGKLLPRLMRCLTWEPDNLMPLYIREPSLHQKGKRPSHVH